MSITIPHTFHDGDLIVASQFNDNFASLDQRTQWVTPEMFGAVGDGVTDDTTAVQAALDSGNNIPITVVLTAGKEYKVTSVVIRKKYITLTGGGTVKNGSVTIGDSSGTSSPKWYVVVENIIFRYGDLVPENDSLTGTTIPSGNNGIILTHVSNITIRGCKFFYCDKAIFIPHATLSTHVNRILTSDNMYQTCNYCVYSERTDLDSTTNFNFGDLSVVGSQAYNTQYTHLYLQGADGLVANANSFFFGPNNLTKNNNIYLDRGNWVSITGNNLFESGTESIYAKRVQNTSITGNNIAWPGQRVNSHGIRLVGGDIISQIYCLSSITGNNIMFPTYSGISIEDNCSCISISGNQIRGAGELSHFIGTDNPALVHYGIEAANTTSYITHSGNSVSGNNNNWLSLYSPYQPDFDKDSALLTYDSVVGSDLEINVKDTNQLRFDQASASTIKHLLNGTPLQEITIIGYNSNTTLLHTDETDGMVLKGGVDATLGYGHNMKLSLAGGKWYEVSRSFENVLVMTGITAASAPNNSIYKDSSTGKLYFKDGSGVANALY